MAIQALVFGRLVVRLRDLLGGFDHQACAGQSAEIGGRLIAGTGKLLVLGEMACPLEVL
jgi:hypothetical protein